MHFYVFQQPCFDEHFWITYLCLNHWQALFITLQVKGCKLYIATTLRNIFDRLGWAEWVRNIIYFMKRRKNVQTFLVFLYFDIPSILCQWFLFSVPKRSRGTCVWLLPMNWAFYWGQYKTRIWPLEGLNVPNICKIAFH